MGASVDSSGTLSASTDRRSCPRATLSVPFRLYGRDRKLLLHARTVDLSPQGALLHGGSVVTVGDRVRFEIPRGEHKNPLVLDARVVRVTPPRSSRRLHVVAIQFTSLTALDEALLARIIAHAQL